MVSGKLLESVDVSVPSIINGVLAADFAEFFIQLTRDSGKPTSLIYFDYLRVENNKNLDNWVDITSLFELTEEGILTRTFIREAVLLRLIPCYLLSGFKID